MRVVLLAASLDLQWIVWPALATVLFLGVLATFAPQRFASLSARGSQWIDTDRLREFLDRSIDVDSYVLRYSRWFGAAVIAAALWLAYLYWSHLSGSAPVGCCYGARGLL